MPRPACAIDDRLEYCSRAAASWPVSDRRTRWRSLTSLANLHLGLLGDLHRIVGLDDEIPNCAFQFRVPEQQLNGSEIAGPPIDHRSFRTSHRMRAVCRCVQTDRIDPRPNNPRILPSLNRIVKAAKTHTSALSYVEWSSPSPRLRLLNQRVDNPSPAIAMIAAGKPMIQRSRVRALVCSTFRTNCSPRVISLKLC